MNTLSPATHRLILLGAGIFLAGVVSAQVPDAPGGPAPAASGGGAASAPAAAPAQGAGGGAKNGSFLGKDVPSFDPHSEVLTWDGKNWNVNDNRVFEARFEKYLNTAEETTATARYYQQTIDRIL